MTEARLPAVEFSPRAVAELGTFDAYLSSLSAPIDSFLEDLILDATPHAILLGDREIGSFAISGNRTLTQFHLVPAGRRWAHAIFAKLREDLGITGAIVPTCDEFLLGLAFDDYAGIEKGAYFFVDGPAQEAPAANERLVYRPAKPGDLDSIRAASGDFLDDPAEELGKGQLHVGHLDGETVALGLIVESRLLTGHASIGIFTREDHRREGIATSTVNYLRQACRARDLTPIAGCWYYNEASRLTLEAAGMIVSSRLLKFDFAKDE